MNTITDCLQMYVEHVLMIMCRVLRILSHIWDIVSGLACDYQKDCRGPAQSIQHSLYIQKSDLQFYFISI